MPPTDGSWCGSGLRACSAPARVTIAAKTTAAIATPPTKRLMIGPPPRVRMVELGPDYRRLAEGQLHGLASRAPPASANCTLWHQEAQKCLGNRNATGSGERLKWGPEETRYEQERSGRINGGAGFCEKSKTSSRLLA